jgi:hypothetical protein
MPNYSTTWCCAAIKLRTLTLLLLGEVLLLVPLLAVAAATAVAGYTMPAVCVAHIRCFENEQVEFASASELHRQIACDNPSCNF